MASFTGASACPGGNVSAAAVATGVAGSAAVGEMAWQAVSENSARTRKILGRQSTRWGVNFVEESGLRLCGKRAHTDE